MLRRNIVFLASPEKGTQRLLQCLHGLGVHLHGREPVLQQAVIKMGDGAGMPVRGVTTKKQLPKGTILATVPMSSCITGATAAPALTNLGKTVGLKDDLTSSVSLVARSVPVETEVPLTRRDNFLQVALLAVLRASLRREGNASAALPPMAQRFAPWISLMPPKTPPIGVVLRNSLAIHEEMSARDVTAAMLRNFYDGKRIAHKETAAELETKVRAAVDAVMKKQRVVEETIIAGLVPILSQLPTGLTVSDKQWHDDLSWAHFMLRSRLVNAPATEDTIFPALVPFLDMLNHSSKNPNIGFVRKTEKDAMPGVNTNNNGSISVLTTRVVEEGEQLTLNYGHYNERLVLLGSHIPYEMGSDDGNQLPQRSRNRMQVHQDMQRIVDEQRWDMRPGGIADEHKQAVAEGRSVAREDGQDPNAMRAKTGEALDLAAWVHLFGFAKSQDELAYEASCVWDGTLKQRIANLTNVRRKGRPGEFVVGVPEGLDALRKERESLNIRRYGGQAAVAPPINRGDGDYSRPLPPLGM